MNTSGIFLLIKFKGKIIQLFCWPKIKNTFLDRLYVRKESVCGLDLIHVKLCMNWESIHGQITQFSFVIRSLRSLLGLKFYNSKCKKMHAFY